MTLFDALRQALDGERGKLIVALYELSPDDLERLIEAAQLIDAEGQEVLAGGRSVAETPHKSLSPREALRQAAEKARAMHRLYPFTKFESSAGRQARLRRKG